MAGLLKSGRTPTRETRGRCAWCSSRDTQRGRVCVGIARGAGGRVIGAGLALRLKPTKKDVAGQSGAVRTFVLDELPRALSAAAAIRAMLAEDLTSDEDEQTPLFRDTETGQELTYAKAADLLKRKLTEAGFSVLAKGLHSLRMGGATVYANADEGGMLVATTIGGWSSTAHRRYVWSCPVRLCVASLDIGRADGLDLA